MQSGYERVIRIGGRTKNTLTASCSKIWGDSLGMGLADGEDRVPTWMVFDVLSLGVKLLGRIDLLNGGEKGRGGSQLKAGRAVLQGRGAVVGR